MPRLAAPCAAGAATAAAVPPMLDANKVAALPQYLRGARLKETSGRRQMRIRGRRAAIRDGTAPVAVLFSMLILVYGVDLPAKRAQDRCQQCIGCSRSSAYRRDRRELRNSAGAAGGGHQRRRRASWSTRAEWTESSDEPQLSLAFGCGGARCKKDSDRTH